MIKTIVVGYGAMGKNHVRVLQQFPEINLLGIYDPELKRIPSLNLLNDSDLNKLDYDYCVIASPTSTHLAQTLKFMRKNVNFLIEKPLTNNLESADKLIDALKDSNSIASVGFIERFNSAIIEMKRQIDQETIGKIIQIITFRQGPNTRMNRDTGVNLDLLTHDIDLCQWLSNSKYRSVFAKVDNPSATIENSIFVTAELANSVIVNNIANWISPIKKREIVIYGEKGVLQANLITADVTLYKNPEFSVNWKELSYYKGNAVGEIINLSFAKDEPLYLQHAEFIKKILGNDSKSVTIKEGFEVLKINNFINTSYKTNQMISVNL